MFKLQEIPVSEVHAGNFDFESNCKSVEFEFSRDSVEFVNCMYLNLFGCLFGVVCLIAEQVQGAAIY